MHYIKMHLLLSLVYIWLRSGNERSFLSRLNCPDEVKSQKNYKKKLFTDIPIHAFQRRNHYDPEWNKCVIVYLSVRRFMPVFELKEWNVCSIVTALIWIYVLVGLKAVISIWSNWPFFLTHILYVLSCVKHCLAPWSATKYTFLA